MSNSALEKPQSKGEVAIKESKERNGVVCYRNGDRLGFTFALFVLCLCILVIQTMYITSKNTKWDTKPFLKEHYCFYKLSFTYYCEKTRAKLGSKLVVVRIIKQ